MVKEDNLAISLDVSRYPPIGTLTALTNGYCGSEIDSMIPSAAVSKWIRHNTIPIPELTRQCLLFHAMWGHNPNSELMLDCIARAKAVHSLVRTKAYEKHRNAMTRRNASIGRISITLENQRVEMELNHNQGEIRTHFSLQKNQAFITERKLLLKRSLLPESLVIALQERVRRRQLRLSDVVDVRSIDLNRLTASGKGEVSSMIASDRLEFTYEPRTTSYSQISAELEMIRRRRESERARRAG